MSHEGTNTGPNQILPESGSFFLHPSHPGLRALMASIHVQPLDETDRAVLTKLSPDFIDEYDRLHSQHLPSQNVLRIVDTD